MQSPPPPISDYRSDGLEWTLYHRRPRFDSVKQFGEFLAILQDRWESPAPASSFGAMLEMARLGVRVDESAPASSSRYEPAEVYHLFWVERLLREAGRYRPSQHLHCWIGADVSGRDQRDLAERFGVASSTVGDWVRGCRDVLAALLAREGMMDRGHLSRWAI